MKIGKYCILREEEIEISAIRAGGAGGQNVNKVSTAIHLRFNVAGSSLPEDVKRRILEFKDRRISKDGWIIIKAQRYRTQEKNRDDARNRLCLLIEKALSVPKPRKPTKPSRQSKIRRLVDKSHRAKIKALRRRVDE